MGSPRALAPLVLLALTACSGLDPTAATHLDSEPRGYAAAMIRAAAAGEDDGSGLAPLALLAARTNLESVRATEALLVFNPLPWVRGVPLYSNRNPGLLYDATLRAIPVQETTSGQFVFCPRLTGFAQETYWPVQAQSDVPFGRSLPRDEFEVRHLAYTLALDAESGELMRLAAREERLELGGGLTLQDPEGQALPGPASVEVIEEGPVRTVLRVQRSVGAGSQRLDLRCYRGLNWIEAEIASTESTGAAFWFLPTPPGARIVDALAKLPPATRGELAATLGDTRSLGFVSEEGRRGPSVIAGSGVLLEATENGIRFGLTAGEQEARLALVPGGKPDGQLAEVLEFAVPAPAIRSAVHRGSLPPRHDFLRLMFVADDVVYLYDDSGLVIAGVEVLPGEDGLLFEILETRGRAGQVRLSFDRDVGFAQEVTDAGEAHSAVEVQESVVTADIAAHGLARIRVQLLPREERSRPTLADPLRGTDMEP